VLAQNWQIIDLLPSIRAIRDAKWEFEFVARNQLILEVKSFSLLKIILLLNHQQIL
jgi:hypothetical protein